MTNQILDEAEKFTGPRTCPNCGHQFPYGEFVKRYVMSYGLLKWKCPSCRELIRCDVMKIQMMWLAGIFVSGILFGLMESYFDLGILNFIAFVPLFAFVLFTLYHAKFEKGK